MAKMRRLALLGAALGLLALPAGASAAVLYDQTSGASAPSAAPDGGTFAPSNQFSATDFDRTADDFFVPAGANWSISQINVTGAYSDTPPNQVNVFIYADASGKPGAEIFKQLGVTPTNGPNYEVPLTGAPNLTGGHYWVTVQQVTDQTAGFWSWGTRTILTGSPAHFISATMDLPNCPQFSWNPRNVCWPSVNPDQVFTLLGTNLANGFQIGKPTKNRAKGTARLPVTIPGAGVITLRGARVIARRRDVAGGRTLRLLVAARGPAKTRLNRTGTARVKVRVTFTPTAGNPRTKTRFIRLRKRLD
jgi:hypothetical protein